jgi:hypothetical protein
MSGAHGTSSGGSFTAATGADIDEGTSNTLAATPLAIADSSLATEAYVDGRVVGLFDLRSAYDASVNTFPASGGSGTAGAILKGDLYPISVAGTLGGEAVQIGDSIYSLTDTPGQTASNWAKMNSNISFVPEDVSNKDTDGTLAANSDSKYPSQKAIKAYVDARSWTQIASESVGTGNDVVISGLPTGWTEVLVKITGLSFDAAATQPLLQFVTSGGNIATGYSAYLATNTSMLPETTGIPVFWSSVAAVDVLKITVRIKRTGALTFEVDGTSISAVRACVFLGDITLASEATGLRLKASGTVNMDGGNISVYAR